MIALFARYEDLSLSLEASKRLRVDDPVAVALEGEARVVVWFGLGSAELASKRNCVGGEETVGCLESLSHSSHGEVVQHARGTVHSENESQR
jgi:hypothetical protein